VRAPAAHRSRRLPELKPYEQGDWLAGKLRTELHLWAADLPAEVGPLATFLEEKVSIDVAIEPLPRGLDGLAIAHRPFGLIMVSSSIPAHRQRYTIAHELGHLLAGDGCNIIDENINIDKTPTEARANAFAAAFLTPAEALRAAVGRSSDLSEQLVADLLGRYRVSLDALAFRLYNADVIDAVGRDTVRRMSSARISLRRGRATDGHTSPTIRTTRCQSSCIFPGRTTFCGSSSPPSCCGPSLMPGPRSRGHLRSTRPGDLVRNLLALHRVRSGVLRASGRGGHARAGSGLAVAPPGRAVTPAPQADQADLRRVPWACVHSS
jgi:IrrE N-terminal-like domain